MTDVTLLTSWMSLATGLAYLAWSLTLAVVR